jgi:hypothetical protein
MVNLANPQDTVEMRSYPLDGNNPFQVGVGANGKNGNDGASRWNNYERTLPDGSTIASLNTHLVASDFLMDLVPKQPGTFIIPEPSSLAIFGTFGLLGVARSRRRKSKRV